MSTPIGWLNLWRWNVPELPQGNPREEKQSNYGQRHKTDGYIGVNEITTHSIWLLIQLKLITYILTRTHTELWEFLGVLTYSFHIH
jgi:hypothetical protein